MDGATYRTMYFAGDGISSLTLEDRMTLTNMAIEAGGKNGVCDVDEKTLQVRPQPQQRPDLGSLPATIPTPQYFSEHEWDLATLEPLVAKPHSPRQQDTAYNCRDVKLDRAYIGSLHRRQNHRHDLRRQHPQGQPREDRHVRRPRLAPKCTPT